MCDYIDVVYPIKMGGAIPYDHHYALHGAIKSEHVDFSERGWRPLRIKGARQGGLLELDAGESELRIRLPKSDTDHIDLGSVLRISDFVLVLGDPYIQPIRPAPVLKSDVVLITSDDERWGVTGVDYGVHIGKRLGAMFGHLHFGVEVGDRRPVHVSGQKHHGNPVTVKGLSDDESIRLQVEGIGQKRAMGCGVFRHA
ncbi:MAG: type I-MYXAN CRISPR-associated protein Cas6/Cmx6 [Trueperaceae bacterium]|nr:type I-MYXAN CRISPR-associated protein Cas6/Cmx6 [Trueperaceae bacterium]